MENARTTAAPGHRVLTKVVLDELVHVRAELLAGRGPTWPMIASDRSLPYVPRYLFGSLRG